MTPEPKWTHPDSSWNNPGARDNDRDRDKVVMSTTYKLEDRIAASKRARNLRQSERERRENPPAKEARRDVFWPLMWLLAMFH